MSNIRLIYAASVIKAANALEHIMAASECHMRSQHAVSEDILTKAQDAWSKSLEVVKNGIGSFSKESSALSQIEDCFTELRRERAVAIKARNERRARMQAEREEYQALFGTAA